MTQLKDTDLCGRFLLAMPGMGDPRFERSVIYMISHDADGAMGFVVNQTTDGLTLGEIAQNLPESITMTGLVNLPVFVGGPVQNDNGFVLYSMDDADENELPVGLTQSMDILVDAARGRGPEYIRLFLGYAGWGPGQIEGEIQENAWLICPAEPMDIFTSDSDALYQQCIARLGIDIGLLSGDGGEA